MQRELRQLRRELEQRLRDQPADECQQLQLLRQPLQRQRDLHRRKLHVQFGLQQLRRRLEQRLRVHRHVRLPERHDVGERLLQHVPDQDLQHLLPLGRLHRLRRRVLDL
jgi:hypothetical protein